MSLNILITSANPPILQCLANTRVAPLLSNDMTSYGCGFRAGIFHSGRSDRHAADGNTGDRRLFLQHPVDVGRRHVSLDDVAVDDGGMARLHLVGHAARFLDLGDVVDVGRADVEAVRAHVLDPLRAASARRRFEHFNQRPRRFLLRGRAAPNSASAATANAMTVDRDIVPPGLECQSVLDRSSGLDCQIPV